MVETAVWELLFTKQALKDAQYLSRAGLKGGGQKLLDVLRANPFQSPPPYEKLSGNLDGAYSRRINLKHRLVYSVHTKEHYVRVIRMWSHYE
ncbi:MAG: Txe/YoeB family addiction module toxin [Candidatus Margulisbacteria bacterium]|jgi:Txe/YoeB family toxin of toxin-antitoxin system|nr:Txe/YoeB family addiction module toxin [Candidatus Margulisiibacteriota bacterium]